MAFAINVFTGFVLQGEGEVKDEHHSTLLFMQHSGSYSVITTLFGCGDGILHSTNVCPNILSIAESVLSGKVHAIVFTAWRKK